MKTKIDLLNNFFIVCKYRLKIDREMIVLIISGLFFLLLLHTAADKLMDFQKFKVQLGQSPILTEYAGHIAWMIPAVEIGVSVLLIIPATRLVGLLGSYGLMVMFTAYIIVIMNFTERIPCSCGGIFSGMKWKEHLIVNVLFVLLGIAGVLLQNKINNKNQFSQGNRKY
jgi:hypothetical protein